MIHAEDLPPALRKRLGLPSAHKPKASRAGIGHAQPCAGKCHSCGGSFAAYSKFEAHPCATAGGARWEITLEAPNG